MQQEIKLFLFDPSSFFSLMFVWSLMMAMMIGVSHYYFYLFAWLPNHRRFEDISITSLKPSEVNVGVAYWSAMGVIICGPIILLWIMFIFSVAIWEIVMSWIGPQMSQPSPTLGTWILLIIFFFSAMPICNF